MSSPPIEHQSPCMTYYQMILCLLEGRKFEDTDFQPFLLSNEEIELDGHELLLTTKMYVLLKHILCDTIYVHPNLFAPQIIKEIFQKIHKIENNKSSFIKKEISPKYVLNNSWLEDNNKFLSSLKSTTSLSSDLIKTELSYKYFSSTYDLNNSSIMDMLTSMLASLPRTFNHCFIISIPNDSENMDSSDKCSTASAPIFSSSEEQVDASETLLSMDVLNTDSDECSTASASSSGEEQVDVNETVPTSSEDYADLLKNCQLTMNSNNVTVDSFTIDGVKKFVLKSEKSTSEEIIFRIKPSKRQGFQFPANSPNKKRKV